MIFLVCNSIYAQNGFNYYISNLGSDSSNGTSPYTTKATLGGSALEIQNRAITTGTVSIGLRAGDVFKEAYKPKHSLKVGSFSNRSFQKFAIMDGAASFDSGWIKTSPLSNSYQQAIHYKPFTGYGIDNIGSYSYIYVYEIDRELEKTAPFTARRLLSLASTRSALDTLLGSFYESPSNISPLLVYIHTSDGLSPNNHPKYRYEVTVYDKAIDARGFDNCEFENLWLRGYGAGSGPLPAGGESRYTNIIFGPGAAIHHAVPKSGIFKRCLFLPGPKNTNAGGAIVFYNDQGLNRNNEVSESIFLDIPFAIYGHTSGTSYRNTSIKKSLFFGPGSGRGIAGANTQSFVLDSLFITNFARGYQSSAPFLTIKNSQFVNLADMAISILGEKVNANVENVFIKGGSSFGIIEGDGTNLKLSRSIFHLNGSFIRKDNSNTVDAIGNIFIVESDQSLGIFSMSNTDAGAGTSADRWSNNVYILVKGKAVWEVSNRNTNGGKKFVDNLKDWQAQSGQDKNSLFFDLRNDHRGLRAVFVDPENGNYELANTVYGNKIRSLGAGMITPPTCLMQKPTYEDAAEMIAENNVRMLNECKSPCQKISTSIKSNKIADGFNSIIACVGENISLHGSGLYPNDGKYYSQNDSTTRFLWWSSDETDTSGINLKTISKKFDSGGRYLITLQMVDINGCTEEVSIAADIMDLPNQPVIVGDTAICVGQKTSLRLKSEAAGEVYNWNTLASTSNSIEIVSPGTYSVRSTNQFGCALSDTFKVKEKIAIEVKLGEDTVYCRSTPLELTPIINGGVQSIVWNNGFAGTTLKVPSAGIYSVTVADTSGCLAKDTIIITDNPLNQYKLPVDTAICDGSTLKLNISVPPNTTIMWNDFSRSPNRILGEGRYSVNLSNNSCSVSGGFLVDVKPLPTFRPFQDTTVCEGYEVLMEAFYPGATYLWSTGDASNKLIIRKQGDYWVQTYLNGCTFRDTISVKTNMCDCDIVLPNAFSPNADGINDLYVPKFSCYPQNYKLRIFDRSGREIFQTADYQKHWNGKFKNNNLPLGTYYYLLSFYDLKRGMNVKRTGSVTLLR